MAGEGGAKFPAHSIGCGPAEIEMAAKLGGFDLVCRAAKEPCTKEPFAEQRLRPRKYRSRGQRAHIVAIGAPVMRLCTRPIRPRVRTSWTSEAIGPAPGMDNSGAGHLGPEARRQCSHILDVVVGRHPLLPRLMLREGRKRRA